MWAHFGILYGHMKNIFSRILTGTAAIGVGLYLCFLALTQSLWMFIYALPILIIGAFIFFNKTEDDIEKIRNEKEL